LTLWLPKRYYCLWCSCQMRMHVSWCSFAPWENVYNTAITIWKYGKTYNVQLNILETGGGILFITRSFRNARTTR
jgi:hypothetical protein